jgi:hypothetical protein
MMVPPFAFIRGFDEQIRLRRQRRSSEMNRMELEHVARREIDPMTACARWGAAKFSGIA